MENSDLKLITVFLRAYSSLELVLRNQLSEYNINTTEFGVLEVLYHKGELKITDINKKILIANSSMTYCIKSLTNKGYIKAKIKDNDKRKKYMHLTKKGISFFEGIFPKHKELLNKVFSTLTEEEKSYSIEILKKIGYYAKDMID